MKIKRKKLIITLSIIGALIVAGIASAFRPKKIEYNTATVEKGKLSQTVSETGTLKSASELKLNFLNSGKISKLNIKVGDKAVKDQVLAELDYEGLKIKEKEASASLEVARADLNKLLAGATNQDIAVSQSAVDQAKASYDAAVVDLGKTRQSASISNTQAQKKLDDLLNDTPADLTAAEQAVKVAKTSYDNTKTNYQNILNNSLDSAITTIEDKLLVNRVALDNIKKVLDDDDAEPYFNAKSKTYYNDVKTKYDESILLRNAAEASLTKVKTDSKFINTALSDSAASLNKTLNALKSAFQVLENSVTGTGLTQASLDAYKTSINTQITLQNAAILSLQTATQNYANAKLAYDNNVSSAEASYLQAKANYDDAVDLARNSLAATQANSESAIASAQGRVSTSLKAWESAKVQLNKILAGANSNDIILCQARMKQAEAAVSSVQETIKGSLIISPINGVITKVNYKIGEQVGIGNSVIEILGENNLNIEVDVSEADIEKISLNNKVEITFDAFSSDSAYNGTVYFIEPAETVIQDVIYYKIKINLDEETMSRIRSENKTLKSGMTANATIIAQEKNDVLHIPNRAILDKDGKKIVRIFQNGNPNEVEVTPGLRGDGGRIEIIQGLSFGQTIIVSIKDKK